MPETEMVEAGAERRPFPDSSFDTVVATLVLCTIPAPREALKETSRVLKPDGRLLFFEHVRSEDAALAPWQDRLERPWGWFGRGCRPNRDTLATIGASPLEVMDAEQGACRSAPASIVEPLVTGEARLLEQT